MYQKLLLENSKGNAFGIWQKTLTKYWFWRLITCYYTQLLIWTVVARRSLIVKQGLLTFLVRDDVYPVLVWYFLLKFYCTGIFCFVVWSSIYCHCVLCRFRFCVLKSLLFSCPVCFIADCFNIRYTRKFNYYVILLEMIC